MQLRGQPGLGAAQELGAPGPQLRVLLGRGALQRGLHVAQAALVLLRRGVAGAEERVHGGLEGRVHSGCRVEVLAGALEGGQEQPLRDGAARELGGSVPDCAHGRLCEVGPRQGGGQAGRAGGMLRVEVLGSGVGVKGSGGQGWVQSVQASPERYVRASGRMLWHQLGAMWMRTGGSAPRLQPQAAVTTDTFTSILPALLHPQPLAADPSFQALSLIHI